MKREKYMDIKLKLMYASIYIAITIVLSIFKAIFGIQILCNVQTSVYCSFLEVYVFGKVAYKILWWICGKIDKLEKRKQEE